MTETRSPQPPHTHRCVKCGTGIMLMSSGDWSTGYPSHLAITCDGINLHRPNDDGWHAADYNPDNLPRSTQVFETAQLCEALEKGTVKWD